MRARPSAPIVTDAASSSIRFAGLVARAVTPPTSALEAGIAATFTIAPVTGTTGNAIREVVIDFGDGTPHVRFASVMGSTPVAHTFLRAGVYTITATVTDTQGIVGISSIVVNVNEQSTVAVTLTGTPNPVSISTPAQQGIVSFTASTGGFGAGVSVQSYSWDFGDNTGAFTTGNTTNHRYTAPGTYIASVSVRTTTGLSGFAQFTVRVNP